MGLKALRVASLLGAGLLGGLAPPTPAGEEIPWTEKVNHAFAEAKSSGKPIFVDVWAVWCVPCKRMEETTYRDPAIVRAMTGFVPLRVDHDAAETFCERYDVEALPLVLYLDADGHEIGRQAGSIETGELLETMNAVRSGYSAYLAALAQTDKSAEATTSVANYLVHAGNPQRAITLLRRAIKDAPLPQQAKSLALGLAEAQLGAGDAKEAAAGFRKLADDATEPEMRGRALEGLVRALRERGRDTEAESVLEGLKE